MPEFDATVTYAMIPGPPGYAAGSDGSIWTCLNRGAATRQQRLGSVWRQVRPVLMPNGYHVVTVCDENGKKQVGVHRLVLFAFHGHPPSGMECRHLNGRRHDNHLSNLAWGTRKANLADRHLHGTMRYGMRNNKTKHTDEEIRELRRLRSLGHSLSDLATKFGLTPSTVSKIVRRLTWSHV